MPTINKQISSTTVAVIGGGSWATALVKILSENDVKIKWWLRKKEYVQHIKKFAHNPTHLSDVQINLKKVKPDTNLKAVITDANFVILASPAAFLREILNELPADAFRGKVVVSAIKGLIPVLHETVADYLEREFNVPETEFCLIGGPCHSEEVAQEKQSYLTVACKDFSNAIQFSNLLNCRFVKTHCLTDVYGVEYAAIMKNIIALASGIAHGLGYGDNFQAVLITNAMQEIKRFIDTIAPQQQRDLNDSAYWGDLLVTAYSTFSRNRTFGNMIGRGYSVKAAQMEMNMIAEGYYATKSMHEILKRYEVEMPITNAVYNILYEKVSPTIEIQILQNLLR